MELTDLATGGGTAIDLTEPGITVEGVLTGIGDWRDINGKYGITVKAPFNLTVDGEERTLWVKKNSRLATVLGAAFKDAGIGTAITVGGVLKVRRVNDVPTDKGNPMHDFQAKYLPPAGSGPELDDF